jgi:2-C-methyl-D-erythritol 4-phosphate cytidylyltransferase/2-C-methyl-D-erythritol 2,4-cyclodiphosphate synthase
VKSAVILVAAGKGERLGLGIPKALVEISGATILEHALRVLEELNPAQVVVVAPQDHIETFKEIASRFDVAAEVVAGGATRQQSVKNGLARVKTPTVLVHDAARCFTPAAVFEAVETALESAKSVVPGLPVTDTIKQLAGDTVLKTLDRSTLVAVQTPQGFEVASLRRAIEETTSDFTDEAGLMESAGHITKVVKGSAQALKVTTPEDLKQFQGVRSQRVGVGTDAHQFSDSGELVLGLLTWPELPKLEGHSDGDSVAHAIVDALLTAAGLGDIGSNFGVDRPEFKGASGEVFLSETLRMISAAGFTVSNVSVQIVGDKPKVGPRRAELENRLSGLLNAPVSVAATTTDGLGFLSDARGVAAVATALLAARS